jgi:hypothetical protein
MVNNVTPPKDPPLRRPDLSQSGEVVSWDACIVD